MMAVGVCNVCGLHMGGIQQVLRPTSMAPGQSSGIGKVLAGIGLAAASALTYKAVDHLYNLYAENQKQKKYKVHVDSADGIPQNTFEDIAGYEKVKDQMRQIVMAFKNPDSFRQVGASPPKGVLLYGPPGTGKTHFARALAGESGASFFYASGSEMIETYAGTGAKRLRELFAEAEQHAPSIVFIDEIDAIGARRSSSPSSDGGSMEYNQTINQLLTCMDGFKPKGNPVVVIAATNKMDVLDEALLRPGRLDLKVCVDLPEKPTRQQILSLHARGKPVGNDIDWSQIADQTAGWSGADLKNLVEQAGIDAALKISKTISRSNFSAAYEKLKIRGRTDHLYKSPNTKFCDVVGYSSVLEKLKQVSHFFQTQESFKKMGVSAPKGILLYGPPGTGKTHMARALAGEVGAAFFHASGSEMIETYVGTGAKRVRELFEQAQMSAPAIIFIDEIDAIGAKRGATMAASGGGMEYHQTINQLLTCMDGFNPKEGSVVVVAATNQIEILDSALLRPGRFDLKIHVDLPDQETRAQILRYHCKGKQLDQNIDLELLATTAQGWSGAELKALIEQAGTLAVMEKRTSITYHDFRNAYENLKG